MLSTHPLLFSNSRTNGVRINISAVITISSVLSVSVKASVLLIGNALVSDSVSLSIDDFNYLINDNKIELNLFLKINGLKEIEAYFPAQEDSEDVPLVPNEEIIEKPVNNEPIKQSLLSRVFKREKIKKTSCYLLHVVKKETSYKEIADNYGLDEAYLKEYNNDASLYEGKLVFIPKDNERDN